MFLVLSCSLRLKFHILEKKKREGGGGFYLLQGAREGGCCLFAMSMSMSMLHAWREAGLLISDTSQRRLLTKGVDRYSMCVPYCGRDRDRGSDVTRTLLARCRGISSDRAINISVASESYMLHSI